MIGALAASIALLAEPVELEAIGFTGLDDGGLDIGCLTLTSGTTLSGDKGIGGYSGLSLEKTPERLRELMLLSDSTHLLQVTIAIDDDGRIEEVNSTSERLAIIGGDIAPFRRHGARRRGGDTEAILPFGDDWLISREAKNDAIRVRVQDGQATVVETLADLSVGGRVGGNKGYETAIAVGNDRYVFIPETKDDQNTSPIVLWDGDKTTVVGRYQSIDDFNVTDGAFDPETGRVFLVERAFQPSLGPRARLTVLPLADVLFADGMTVTPHVLGKLTLLEGIDNMEGLDVFNTDDGGTHLILVSDDNFNEIQRTVLLTLRVNDSCPLSPAQP